MRELVIPTEETVNDWNIANDHAGDDTRCPDHWHCDPELAAHDCQTYRENGPRRGQAIDRTSPCPTCGDSPVTGEDSALLDFEERIGGSAERITFFVGTQVWMRFREECEANGIGHFDALREYIDEMTRP
jgi:hypothetical protein